MPSKGPALIGFKLCATTSGCSLFILWKRYLQNTSKTLLKASDLCSLYAECHLVNRNSSQPRIFSKFEEYSRDIDFFLLLKNKENFWTKKTASCIFWVLITEFSFRKFFVSKRDPYPELYSEPCQTSKMERLVKIVNSF